MFSAASLLPVLDAVLPALDEALPALEALPNARVLREK
jgi:hypothetical protein